jgi:hypothetical protein
MPQISSKGNRHSERSRGNPPAPQQVTSRDGSTPLDMTKQCLALHIAMWKKHRAPSFTSTWTAFMRRLRFGTDLHCAASLSLWAAPAIGAAF